MLHRLCRPALVMFWPASPSLPCCCCQVSMQYIATYVLFRNLILYCSVIWFCIDPHCPFSCVSDVFCPAQVSIHSSPSHFSVIIPHWSFSLTLFDWLAASPPAPYTFLFFVARKILQATDPNADRLVRKPSGGSSSRWDRQTKEFGCWLWFSPEMDRRPGGTCRVSMCMMTDT